jgi:hypothetical protein
MRHTRQFFESLCVCIFAIFAQCKSAQSYYNQREREREREIIVRMRKCSDRNGYQRLNITHILCTLVKVLTQALRFASFHNRLFLSIKSNFTLFTHNRES